MGSDRHRFLSELDAALRILFDREVQITIIKSRYYDLGIPRKWRELLKTWLHHGLKVDKPR